MTVYVCRLNAIVFIVYGVYVCIYIYIYIYILQSGLRHQVGADGQGLPRLDEGRPEAGEHLPGLGGGVRLLQTIT